MIKLKQVLALSLFASAILYGCSKSNDTKIEDPNTQETNIIIYGGKMTKNSSGYNDSIPAYWVNGIEKPLANAQLIDQHLFSTVAVSKTGKVHIITNGFKNSENGVFLQYWIDGVEQFAPASLKEEALYNMRAAVKDEKLHLVAHKVFSSKAGYWIDGVAQSLPGNLAYFSDIAVSTDEAYVAFAGASTSGKGMFLVNGTATELTNGMSADRIGLLAGGNVYVTGGVNSSSIMNYWTGGVMHSLPNSSGYFSSTSITVSDGKVYVGANVYNNGSSTPRYWIDGVEQSLPQGLTQLNDVAVSDNKVYLLGLAGTKAKYWIDGVAKDLPDAVGYAERIFIIKK